MRRRQRPEKIEAEIRRKIPGKARRADYGRSRAAAIDLHCQACSGGSRKAATECTIFDCFLHPHGPAREPRPLGYVPTEAEYEERLAEREPVGFARATEAPPLGGLDLPPLPPSLDGGET